eukprot:CAMPEP_0195086912 /NCGR_PEP_ID=MMETSP0448-20130528/26908_1 /TAXON_ID=66468 /ORGANISM="Heterocapsa triquestra, Strain CCMP 448" /LENGTH=85 /DNA_ID=CAMNT_0040120431 /DNA_START=247 /DNA_END=505 /DNA_ORIENTATION=+
MDGQIVIGNLTTPTRRAVLWLAHMAMSRERFDAPPLQYFGWYAPVASLDKGVTLASYGLSEQALEILRQEAEVEPELDLSILVMI